MSQKPIPERITDQFDVQMEEFAEDIAAEEKLKKQKNVYSNKQRPLLYYFNRIKLWEAAPSGRMTITM